MGVDDVVVEEEVDWPKEEANEARLVKATPNFGKKAEHRWNFWKKGSFQAGPSWQINHVECDYCGKFGQHDKQCRKKKTESAFTSRQLNSNLSYIHQHVTNEIFQG